ncbi:MAG TPA: hypothetical protein GXX20_09185 [Clostridiaceae bacterium]|nr:hypothetical protein [Clostridiaceae bacterium]
MKKKFYSNTLTILLCVVYILSSGIFVPLQAQAETGKTISTLEKANVLNKLTILRGDNGDYKLADSLLRCEAAAFIVRLLGKETYVLENKEDYWVTRFPDVISTEWYAPYVGYCTRNGIISGDEYGNFNPNAAISEKAFLKLILGSLGFEYGIDFTWEEVYRKAYQVGLVEDSTYLTKTADNFQYTRGQVVDVMFRALTIEYGTNKETLLGGLVKQNVVSLELVESLNIGKIGNISPGEDIIEEADVIEQIFVIDQNRLVLRLSKDIETIKAEQITIYKTHDFTNKLDVEIQAQSEQSLVINTSDQESLEDYTIEIRNAIYKNNKKQINLIGEFTGYENPELKSDFFRISKVKPISKNAIQVYFTHPVNINSEDSSYYVLFEGNQLFVQGNSQTLTVKASDTGEYITIYLNAREFSGEVNYILQVSGNLISAYGCKLNEGEGDSIKFRGVAIDPVDTANDEELRVIKISTVDSSTIQLDFNKEINPVLAKQIYNFYVTDENDIPYPIKKSKAVAYGGSNKSIAIGMQTPLINGKNYKIMINNINDISRQYSIIEKEYTFTAAYPQVTYISITNAYAVDNSTVVVQFNKMLDAASAVNVTNYQLYSSPGTTFVGNPAKVYYDEINKPYEVKLFLSEDKKLEAGKIYKVKILNTLQDYLGNNVFSASEFGFAGTNTQPVKPNITDAIIISGDAIKITFNKDIVQEMPNINPSNYLLQYTNGLNVVKKVPISIIYIDSKTMVLKFDSLDFETSYKISALELKDYSGTVTNLRTEQNSAVTVRMGKR